MKKEYSTLLIKYKFTVCCCKSDMPFLKEELHKICLFPVKISATFLFVITSKKCLKLVTRKILNKELFNLDCIVERKSEMCLFRNGRTGVQQNGLNGLKVRSIKIFIYILETTTGSSFYLPLKVTKAEKSDRSF